MNLVAKMPLGGVFFWGGVKGPIGVWAGGHGHVPPQNFYGRAKITAKFGQNIKISEKF